MLPHPLRRTSRCFAFLNFILTVALVEPLSAAESANLEKAEEAEPAVAADLIERSVVKIFSTVRKPDYSRPWTKQPPKEVTGSGIVIEGKRILTNAHVVFHATQIQIQANQSGEKLSASLEAFSAGMDLAILKLEDESFFDSHPPLARSSSLTQVKEPVLVYGYPTGGTSLSITKGIVSRTEFAAYRYPISGLRMQIDAAINPGNSGGPAIVGDKVVGLAFSHLNNSQNIGYIIPSEEIEVFLQDIADGSYSGKPSLYDEFQTLENPALRSFLKIDRSIHGVIVKKPYLAKPDYPLKTWDIVTKVGDSPIDDQGMIKAGDNLRLQFLYAVQKNAKDGQVPLTIHRGGETLNVSVPVFADRPKLIGFLEGGYPSYFIYGPIVFSPVTENTLGAIASNQSLGAAFITLFSQRNSPMVTRRGDPPAFPGEELVMVSSPFFPHKLAKGYSNPAGLIVAAINGVAVKNLLHLVELLRDSQAEFTVINFAGLFSETLVLPHQECLMASEEILNDSGIRAQGSLDTLSVWNKTTEKVTTITPAGKPN